ncbi:hypothetical protein BT96DRAFT_993547 [Gymnopus androsaceus JB14]|uniref:Cdc24/Scd1 N-terminal domain-containing protein n=1 Tax=Gymnopus androsaceus JB14 TaxID=1447944 RepID=A0A6A4HT59_9AGAR|nr:hypothetical protein BT96DRAFT_993547 [Gymnopus androsaceus JB14]
MAQDDLQAGFNLYSDLLNEADPVACIRGLFAIGIPLCHLFNLLPHRLYPKIDLDFTLRDDEYMKRIAIAQFALRSNQAFGCSHFSINDVLDPAATIGFHKALNAVSVVLDQLRLNEIKGPAKQLDRTSTKEVPYKDDSNVHLRIGQ